MHGTQVIRSRVFVFLGFVNLFQPNSLIRDKISRSYDIVPLCYALYDTYFAFTFYKVYATELG